MGPPVPLTPDGSFLSHSCCVCTTCPALCCRLKPTTSGLALFSPARDSGCLKPGPEGAAAETIPVCRAAQAASCCRSLPRCPLWPVAKCPLSWLHPFAERPKQLPPCREVQLSLFCLLLCSLVLLQLSAKLWAILGSLNQLYFGCEDGDVTCNERGSSSNRYHSDVTFQAPLSRGKAAL